MRVKEAMQLLNLDGVLDNHCSYQISKVINRNKLSFSYEKPLHSILRRIRFVDRTKSFRTRRSRNDEGLVLELVFDLIAIRFPIDDSYFCYAIF